MGNNWQRRHRRENEDFQAARKLEVELWAMERNRRFPTDADFLKHIRGKLGWPKYNKYQLNHYSQGEGAVTYSDIEEGEKSV